MRKIAIAADILCLGGLTIDIHGTSHELKEGQHPTQLDELKESFGGRGANFLMFSRIFDVDTLLVGPAGSDFAAKGYHEYLSSAGADTSGLFQCKSSKVPITYSFNDNQDSRNFFYGTYLGKDSDAYIKHAMGFVKNSKYSALYATSGTQKLNELALATSKTLNFYAPAHETAYHTTDSIVRCLRNTDFLLLNEKEAEVLQEKLCCNASRLQLMFGIKAVIVTRGSKGSMIYTNSDAISIPAYKPKAVVGTTGTGDAYAAAFIASYLKTGDIVRSAYIASATASFVVEKLGCQSNIPRIADVMERMRKQNR
jgi:ribokinase